MCSIVTKIESTRKDNTARSTCPEVTVVETVVCAIPAHNYDHILPHPYKDNVFINVVGDDFKTHGWFLNSNPYHSFQPVRQTSINGYIVEARGRQIKTRGGVSISFLPTKQVLADRIVYHHDY